MKIVDHLNKVGCPTTDVADLLAQLRRLGKNERYLFLYGQPFSPTLRFVPMSCPTPTEQAAMSAFLTSLRPHLITKEQSEQMGMALIKARQQRVGDYIIDSLGNLSMCDDEPKSQDDTPEVPGYKLRSNATSMYQMFVARNHRR